MFNPNPYNTKPHNPNQIQPNSIQFNPSTDSTCKSHSKSIQTQMWHEKKKK